MREAPKKTRTIEGLAPGEVPWAALLADERPVILKGLARHWPLVETGRGAPDQAMAYLQRFYAGRPVVRFSGAAESGGRFFYNSDFTGFNFDSARAPLGEVFAGIRNSLGEEGAPALYVGSTDVDDYFPGLRAENDLVLNDAMFEQNRVLIGIWLGARTVACAHYDLSNNIACCAVGRRRFTLFPPEQIENLYPGPLEPTPGGQVVSMVDFRAPDFERYPHAREALAAAEVADLEPGDALLYPALWWHQVEALDDFNVMINYWWNTSPAFIDTPQATLLHALLSLRDRPEHEKRGWRALFDYYVFGPAARPAAHVPEAARGALAPMDEARARRLRAHILNKLNR